MHVVDIRSVPRSRTNPQFNKETLPDALAAFGIAYTHLAALGGLRGRARTIAPGANAFWSNPSFHNYADYALTAPFRAGFGMLVDLGHRSRCTVMCSEAVWWRCHRRIVADYLMARGESVFHLMGEGRLDPAHLTPGARIQPDGSIEYPAATAEAAPIGS